jgi:hypothetical protein
MTEPTTARGTRPGRSPLPTLVAGIVIGSLASASLVPLLGADRTVPSASTDSTSFLNQGGSTGTTGAAGGTTGGIPSSGPSGLTGTTGTGGAGTGASTGLGSTGTAGNGGAGGGSGAGGTGAPGESRKASDIGITKDVIRVGVITLKCDSCSGIGVASVDEEPIAHVFEKDLNDRGGINGRQVKVFTGNYDPVQDAIGGGGTSRQACLKVTDQAQVFAVVGGSIAANACIYDEHKTPLITDRDTLAVDPTSFNRSGGRLWTLNPSPRRILVDWARQTKQLSLLPSTTTKFGVVAAEGTGITQVQANLLPALKQLGYTPTRVSVLPSDPATVNVKAAQEASAMKAAGVTHVFMAADYFPAQAFIRESERDDYRPQYLASDFPTGGVNWVGDQNAQAGTSWGGAIAISSQYDFPYQEAISQPIAKDCLNRYRKAGGGAVSQANAGPIIGMCQRFNRFEDAMKRAGINPTRKSYLQALAATGTFSFLGAVGGTGRWGGPYAFGPVLWSALTHETRKVWKMNCPYDAGDDKAGCYVAVGSPFAMAA